MKLAAKLVALKPAAMSREETLLRARLLLVKLGWPGWLGVALILVWAIATLFWLPRQEAQAIELQESSRSLRRDINRLVAEAPGRRSPEARLQALRSALPERAELPRLLDRLQEVAGNAGVTLNSAEYPVESSQADGLFAGIAVVYPVKADFRRLRRLLVEIRSQMPMVAIEDIQVKRDNLGTTEVEARLRLRIYLRRPA